MNARNDHTTPDTPASEPTTYFGHDPVNRLRVLADFDHMPRHGIRPAQSFGDVYDEVLNTTTALEFVIVVLHELEDQQVRADYLRTLLEPHVAQLGRTTSDMSVLIDQFGAHKEGGRA